MKDDLTSADGTAAENGVGTGTPGNGRKPRPNPVDSPTASTRGIRRVLFDSLLIAAGVTLLAVLNGIQEYVNFSWNHELSFELIMNGLIGVCILFVMIFFWVGAFLGIAGAILSSKGVFDEKKKRPSEPEKPESN